MQIYRESKEFRPIHIILEDKIEASWLLVTLDDIKVGAFDSDRYNHFHTTLLQHLKEKDDIGIWFDNGIKLEATHMAVVCDTFDYENYPAYVNKNENANEKIAEFNRVTMQKVMEVYNLAMDKETQLNQFRVFNY